MNNITLFAGAGFSKAVAEKVHYNPDHEDPRMLSAYEILNNPSTKRYFEQNLGGYVILECYLKKEFNDDYKNISYEEIYQFIKDDNKISISCKNELMRKMENLVAELLANDYPPTRYADEANQTAKLIRYVLKKYKIGSVITTNPDILLEVAVMNCTQFDMDLISKFNIFKNKIQLLSTNLRPVINLSRKNILPDINNLIKIHGSFLFLRCNKCNKNTFLIDRYQWERGGSIQVYINTIKEIGCSCGSNDFRFCVIPPLTNKSDEYSKEPWITLFMAAENVLRNTSLIIFYGFGFSKNDKAMMKLFKDYNGKADIYDTKLTKVKSIKDRIDRCKFKKQVKIYLPNANINFKTDIEELDNYFK